MLHDQNLLTYKTLELLIFYYYYYNYYYRVYYTCLEFFFLPKLGTAVSYNTFLFPYSTPISL